MGVNASSQEEKEQTGILMELLRSGLSVKKTVKSFSEKIEKQFLKMRRKKGISKPDMISDIESRKESITWPEITEHKEMHWKEALEREKLRLIIHSQSLPPTGNLVKPFKTEPKENDHYETKLRLPTPPTTPKLSQPRKLKSQCFKRRSLGIHILSDSYTNMRQEDSDDSGRGDSEWSDVSECSTKSYSIHNKRQEMHKLCHSNVKTKTSSENISNKLKILKIAEQNISQNHDEIYSFLAYLSNTVKPGQLEKISSYVADLEKITFLLHSLARRLAAAELRIKLTKVDNLSQEEKAE